MACTDTVTLLEQTIELLEREKEELVKANLALQEEAALYDQIRVLVLENEPECDCTCWR